MSKTRLEQKLHFTAAPLSEEELADGSAPARMIGNYSIENSSDFISMLHEREGVNSPAKSTGAAEKNQSPIYLLNSFINRTEQQNRLSFLNKTAFDGRDTGALSLQYAHLAKEIEDLISVVSESDVLTDTSTTSALGWGEDNFTEMR